MNATTNTTADRFLEFLGKLDVSKECVTRATEDVEKYDGDALNRLTHPVVIQLQDYGYYTIISPQWFRNDPYSARNYAFQSKNAKLIAYIQEGFIEVDKQLAIDLLYNTAKELGFIDIPRFNNVEGYIISWEEFLGSVPEFMREKMTQVNMDELKRLYEMEKDCLLRYMTMQTKMVEVKNTDTEESEWVEKPISKLSVQFNRFRQISEDDTQTTAFFSVSDISPDFTPEVSYNWHLQDTSRWIYAGAIAINIYHGKLTFSSNH